MRATTKWKISNWIAAGLAGMLVVWQGSLAWSQSTPPVTPPPPPAPAAAPLTPPHAPLPLAPIAEPLQEKARAHPSGLPNLFGQEQGRSVIGEQRQTVLGNVNQRQSSTQPGVPAGPRQSTAMIDLLRQAGIAIDVGDPNHLAVERVLPNSAAFRAGLLPGDVITGVTFGLRIDRAGESRQLYVSGPLPKAVDLRPGLEPLSPAPTASHLSPPGGSTGAGVSGSGTLPQGSGTPGLGSSPPEGGGSAAMRTGQANPVLSGRGTPR